MPPWTQIEIRWLQSLFDAIIAGSSTLSLPPLSKINQDAFWQRYQRRAPKTLRAGLRFFVWLLIWLPLFWGRGRFHRLSASQQQRALEDAASSRFFVVRQAIQMVKLFACFAYFHDPAIREQIERLADAQSQGGKADA